MARTLRWALRIGLPLVLGGLCYVLLRPDTWISAAVYALTGLEPPALSPAGVWAVPAALARNFLPDCLWAAALAAAVRLCLGRSPAAGAASLALGAGLELAQLPGWLPGTFDWADLALEAVSIAAMLLWIDYTENKEERT